MLSELALSTPSVVSSYTITKDSLLLELRGMLADDARAQHVCHM